MESVKDAAAVRTCCWLSTPEDDRLMNPESLLDARAQTLLGQAGQLHTTTLACCLPVLAPSHHTALSTPCSNIAGGSSRPSVCSCLFSNPQSAMDTLKQANPATRDLSEKHC